MGWLDIIFGKGASRKLKPVTKAIRAATKAPPPTSPAAPVEATNQWRRTDKGNLTFLVPGNIRLTVFPQDGGWKFIFSDDEDGEDLSTYFSPPFATEEIAKAEAIAFITGRNRTHESLWDIKKRDRRAKLPEEVPRRQAQLADITAAVERQEKAKTPKASTVHNLLKRARTAERGATHTRNLMRERVKDPNLVREAEAVMSQYPALISRIQAVIDRLPADAPD